MPAKRSEAPGEIDHLACCDIMFSSGRSLNLVEHTEDHRIDVFAFGLVDPSPVDTDGSHPPRSPCVSVTQSVGQHAERVAVGEVKPVAAVIEQGTEAVAVSKGASAHT